MKKHSRNMMWPLAWAWLVGLVCNVAFAAAPSDWIQENVPNYQHAMTIMARVYQNGSALKVAGSMVAVFYNGELRAIAPYDNKDGLYFYNLTVMCAATTESGYTFKYYDPNTDKVYDLTLPAGYDPLVYKQAEYGGFPPPTYEFEPFILTLPSLPTVKYTLTPSTAKWKIDSGSWNASGATVTTTVGSHTITFSDVTGYTTPSSQTITLSAGQALTKTVSYTATPPTVKYTLTPSTAKWKIDSGSWNASGATVTTTAGSHTITFSDVTGYTTPTSQTITLSAGETFTKSVSYTATSPTVKYTLTPSSAKWKIDSGSWNASGATVTTTVGSHTITFSDVTGYTTPTSQTITLISGQAYTKSVSYTSVNVIYHPADFEDEDGNDGGDWLIDGFEYQKYAAPVKKAALGGYEYTWDGVNVMSIAKKANTRSFEDDVV
nr:hypothetical protein [Lentisphaeria bacterium]